jgi:hypothetical protein
MTTTQQITHSRRRRLGRWLRVAAFLFVVVSASAWWKIRQVKANFSELSASVGSELSRLQEIAAGTSTLKINGQRFTMTSATSDESVKTVVDRFSASCMKSTAGLAEQLRDLEANGVKLPAMLSTESVGVLRMEKNENEVTAACFARPGSGGYQDLLARLGHVVDSGDLAELGQLRYVLVRRHGTSDVTHVLAITALGQLPLASMFPDDGDAPGSDLLNTVRPAHARRVISAQLEGTTHETTLYEATGTPEDALGSYDSPLRARGFQLGDLGSAANEMNPIPTRVYFKSDDMVVVLAVQHDESTSLVSAFRLANGGFTALKY